MRRSYVLFSSLVPALILAAILAAQASAEGAPAPKVVPGEVIVKFAPSTGAAQRSGARDALDLQLDHVLPLKGVQQLSFDDGRSPGAIARALEKLPGVVYAEPNYKLQDRMVPNDPLFQFQWDRSNAGPAQVIGPGYIYTPPALDADIDATDAWDVTTGVASVKVAVIDTGVDFDHPDLAASIWQNPGETGTDGSGNPRKSNGVDDDNNGYVDDWHGWDAGSNTNDPSPTADHGTEVAGVVGAVGNNGTGVAGMAWGASVVPVRQGGTTSTAAVGIAYAKAAGAQIANMSFGAYAYSQVMEDAMAAAPGTLFVAAAGNEGLNNDTIDDWPCNSTLKNVVCVTGSDPGDLQFDGLNYGPTTVDLTAPASWIYTTSPGGGYVQTGGTSFAAPLVAGTAALMKSVVPLASPAQIRQALIASVDSKPTMTGKTVSGGRLNSAAAIQTLQSYGITTDTTGPSPQISFPRTGTWIRSSDGVRWGDSGTSVNTECVVDGGAPFACSSPLAPWWSEGSHTVTVTETDLAGNVGTSTVTFGAETYPPSVNITSPVGTVTANSKIHFTTSAASGIQTYASGKPAVCILDDDWGQVFECGDGTDLPAGLADGPHTLIIRVISKAGNLTDKTQSFTVDGLVPFATITSSPPAATNSTSPTFTFTASEPATFQCSLDNGPYASCSSPKTYTGVTLETGHSLGVIATDLAGNQSSVAAVSWMTDTTAPSVAISSPADGSSSTATSRTLSFSVTDASSHTETCKLDAGAFAACPASLTGLAVGSHTVSVKSTDAAGNTSTAVSTFTVLAPASLTVGTPATIASSVNLTTLGTLDWVHWGRSTATTVDRKTGTAQITDATLLGSGGTRTRVTSSIPTYTWSNGTPVASGSTASAIYIGGATNRGFRVTAPASNGQLKVLTLYLGALSTTGKLTVSLSDGSAPTVVNTSVSTSSVITPINRSISITYRSTSNATLTADWQQNTSSSLGRVYLHSATLTG